MRHIVLIILLFASLTLAKSQNKITSYQYWFDDGSVVPLTTAAISPVDQLNLNTTFSTEALSEGLHTFHIRFQDTNGRYSPATSSFFYKKPNNPLTGNEITKCNYWFDNGSENPTSIPFTPAFEISLSNSISTDALSNGLHILHLQLEDAKEQKSAIVSQFFYKKAQQVVGKEIVTYEYWLDKDHANATQVSLTASETLNLLTDLDFSSTKAGLHQLNIRFKDTNGQWSSILSEEFLKVGITMDDHLIAHYPFDGDANDVSDYNNHGTADGTTLTEDRHGISNSAYLFDGNDKIDVPHAGIQDMTGAMSISCWIKPSEISGTKMILGKSNYTSTTNYLLRLKSDASLQWEYQTYAQNDDLSIAIDNWYHIVVTADAPASGQKIYINNQLASISNPSGGTYGQINSPLTIGYASYGSEYFKGIIDDVRIYNKALTTDDISSLFNQVPTNTEIIFLNDIKLYPNPVIDELKVDLPMDGEKRLSLYDVGGCLVYQTISDSNIESINMSDLKCGLYILKIDSDNASSSHRIIKK
ncbi:LamG-like jellyroll fold domain-containing protein [Carboxylicivirga sp. N1Y90]|uniref:LamG-like jellyroll fold domain-containing protein n=1 Tax=Carboxylicivirga fragile TaxID=3417571 RepID=UPI003D347E68|nr:T9SS type A sorting domain-containing protein [Marinilabiliaceae bacterium N1Y90]